jgi:hypothetical protein
MPPQVMSQWYYKVLGQEAGPVSPAELKELAGSGFLTPDVLVRKGADGDWFPAADVRGLFQETPEEAPEQEAGARTVVGRPTLEEPAEPISEQGPAEEEDWYCRAMGKEIGPLSPAVLRELAAAGFLSPDVPVRMGPDGQWGPASQVEGLFDGPPSLAAPSSEPREEPAAEVEWHYQAMGQKVGPVAFAELAELAAAGFITPDVLVRKGSEGEWVPAETVKGLFDGGSPAGGEGNAAMEVPPPIPAARPPAEDRQEPERGTSDERAAVPARAAPSPAADAPWYYKVAGDEIGQVASSELEIGPLAPSELKELADRGVLRPGSLIRRGTDGRWRPARRVKGLFDDPARGR